MLCSRSKFDLPCRSLGYIGEKLGIGYSDDFMGNTKNEAKRLDVLGLDLQMFTEMMVGMSNLPSLK